VTHAVISRLVPGMGGAMDLVTGAKRVVVAMQHSAKGIAGPCAFPQSSNTLLQRVWHSPTRISSRSLTAASLVKRASAQTQLR
jgi:acyl CoA:acetate/3-ketoacid CoA transferase beta subunit